MRDFAHEFVYTNMIRTSERHIQIAVVDYCRVKKIPAIHIANERKCSAYYGRALKKQGVTAGVSDLFIMHPQAKKFGLWLELKSPEKKPTSQQQEWLDHVISLGYYGAWADNVDDAIEIIDDYLTIL